MPRPLRITPPGVIFHVINRGNEKRRLFQEPRDYAQFVELLAATARRFPVAFHAYCLMPNHWHLVVEGLTDRGISNALQWLTCCHACHLRRKEGTLGHGHVYQARFHGFAIGSTRHLLNVLRYVEGNALRSHLVTRAEDWRWCSLWDRPRESTAILSPLPWPLPENWIDIVNTPIKPRTLIRLQRSVKDGCPFGSPPWADQMSAALQLSRSAR